MLLVAISRLRLWLWACGLLVLAAGGAVGFLLGDRWGGSPGPEGGRVWLLQPDVTAFVLLRSEEIWSELGLADEQKREITELLAEHYEKDRSLRGELDELAGEAYGRLVALLTDEQRKNMREIIGRYGEAYLEAEVAGEIALMRREVGLSPEQEPDVSHALYVSNLEKRKFFRGLRDKKQRPNRDEFRAKMQELNGRRDERLANFLTDEQLQSYRSLCEKRRRRWRGKGGERRATPRGKPEP
ncbi:MAG: hypothetical protein O7J95_05165 [Planctomycetota bacterium]|nr:hypothetical protein [Planctomycetota bacterium]